MSRFPSLEGSSLKRKGSVPPDVYCQRNEQKEDILSEDFVRDGYKYMKPVRDEYESCREESKFVSADALWNFFYTVMTHKYELCGDQDLKKRPATIRDSVVPVIDMNKGRISDWFKELAGSVPLQTLKRRVPYSKDKNEILGELLNNKVPVSRALWFINTSIIQISAMAENAKKKPRAPLDPTVEWTASVCRKLTGILESSIAPDLVSSETTVPVSETDWNYFFSLLIAMHNVDIADRWEVLVWLVKTAEGLSKLLAGTFSSPGNSNHAAPQMDGLTASPGQQQTLPQRVIFTDSQSAMVLKFFLFQLVRVGNWFRESELLSRRLLYWCCSILHDVLYTYMPANMEYSSQTGERSRWQQAVIRAYASVMHTCPLHAIVITSLSGLIACLVCNCPSAAVWNSIPIETEQVAITGSPLDLIPFSLVYLPMPPGCETASIRKCLAEVERNIITRGRLAQLGWNRQAMTSSSNGEKVERMVRLLDILDGQDFYILKEANPMEALYTRIFKDDAVHADTGAVVTLLCEWAVSAHQVGIHRPIIVACILEHLMESFRSEAAPRRLLQATLVNFLDAYTRHLPPFTTEQAPVDNESMRNLVCMFAELIDRELFDHDAYVRHFIARGDFDIGSQPPLVLEALSASQSNAAVTTVTSTVSVYTPTGSQNLIGSLPLSARGSGAATQASTGNSSLTTAAQCSVASELSEDNDRCSVENPDSVRSELGFPSAAATATMGVATHQQQSQQTSVPRSGHLHYLVQFPIPQDEAYSHEQNQRSRLLYGSVRMRDRARSRVRRLFRDIVKMLTRKAYLIDVVHGEVYRRRKPKERDRDKDLNASVGVNTVGNLPTSVPPAGQSKCQSDEARSLEELHQDIRNRFLSLSFYDMECVISQCTPTLVKVLNGCNAVAAAAPALNAATGGSVASATTAPFTPLSSGEDTSTNFTGTASANPASPSVAGTFAGGGLSYNYMPLPSSIFLFFELIETSSNITCLIATIVDTLEKLHVLFESRTQFMTRYMSALCLRAIGLCQRYQPVLLTMGDLSCRLFRCLIDQVRQVKEPTQCRLLERCILAYLNDLFNSSVLIKTKFTSIYGKAHHKVAALFRNAVIPGEGATTFDPNYVNELLNSVSSDNLALFIACTDDLRNNAQCRFSFVCRAIICVCQAKTNERLDYLCGLCAEMTSQCGELTSEWLRALYAVLASRPHPHGYSPPLVDLSDLSMYDSLSSLIGTLLSRYCFTISDFLCLVICPVMAQGLDHAASPVGSPLEPVIRLACHILHRLFTAELPANTSTGGTTRSTAGATATASSNVQTPNQQEISGSAAVTASSVDSVTMPSVFRISEPLLLTGALQKVTSEFLIDLLKLLIVHSDKTAMDIGMPQEPHSSSADTVGQAGSDSDDQHHPHGGEAGDEEGGPTGAVGDSDEASLSDDYHRGGDNDAGSRRRRGKASSNFLRRKQSSRSQWHGRRGQTQISSNSPSSSAVAVAAVETVNHPIVQRFLEFGTLPTTTELQNLPLGGLIQLVLREICTASWVRERFAQMSPEFLTRDNVLIDKNFSHSQARHLLHIICSPYDLTWTDIAQSSREGLASAMCSVLSSLNQWSMRSVQMKVELLKAQINFSQQSEVLGHVAQSLVHGFQTQVLNWLTLSDSSGLFIDGSVGPIGGLPNFEVDENDKVWLLPALMAKLPRAMKTPIVKATLEMLKGIRQFWKHKNDEDKETVLLKHSIILAHPAFFTLLQLCIQDHDPIYDMPEQIDFFVQNARETEDRVPDNLRTRQVVQECLRLRLTLVGQRFQTIQSDPDVCSRWALLLTQLITHGVTEPESNSTLFYMVIDMLQTLIHTLVARSGLDGKHYLNVVKKIRRELAERPSCSGIERIRPLLIPSKTAYSLFVTGRRWGGSGGPAPGSDRSGTSGVPSLGGSGSLSVGGGVGPSGGGSLMGKSGGPGKSSFKASGCYKSAGAAAGQTSARCRRGYTLVNKECFAPWELLDPNRQSSLLLKHGAIRTEALPSHAEEQINRLIIHDHYVNTRRKPQFYLCPFYPETEEVQSSTSLIDSGNAVSVEVVPASLSGTNDAVVGAGVRSSAADFDGPSPAKRLAEKAENRIGSLHNLRGTGKLHSQGQADLTQFHSETTTSLMGSQCPVRLQLPLTSSGHHFQQHHMMTSKADELEGYMSISDTGGRSTRQIQQQQLLDPNAVHGQLSSMQDYHGCDMHSLSSGQHMMQATSHAADLNYPLPGQVGHYSYDQPQSTTAVFSHPAMHASDSRAAATMQQQSATSGLVQSSSSACVASTTSSMVMIVMDRGGGYPDALSQAHQPPHAQHIVGSDSAIPSKTVKYMPSTRLMPGQLMGLAGPNQELHQHGHPHQQRQQQSQSGTTQAPPAKRKRGSGRRSLGAAASNSSTSASLAAASTPTATVRAGFRAGGQQQMSTEGHAFAVQPGAAYEFPLTTADLATTGAGTGDEEVWYVKSEANPCLQKPDMRGRAAGGIQPHQQMAKNAGHSTNLATFLRNRGRQQQQQVASVQQKHHMYPGSFAQAQQHQQHLDLNCHRVIQQTDGVMMPSQPYGITDQDNTSFAYSLNSDAASSAFNESGIVGSQVPRTAPISMLAGKLHQIPCDPVTYSTQAMPPIMQTTAQPQTYRLPPQATPNPPPYPSTSHQSNLGQQHGFHPRPTGDDAYFIIMEQSGCEDVYQQQQSQRQEAGSVYSSAGHVQAMSHPHHQMHQTQHHHLQQPPQQQTTMIAQEQMHMIPGGGVCLASSQPCHQPLMINTRSGQQQQQPPLTLMTMVPANATAATVVSQTPSKMPTTAVHPQQMPYSQYPNF